MSRILDLITLDACIVDAVEVLVKKYSDIDFNTTTTMPRISLNEQLKKFKLDSSIIKVQDIAHSIEQQNKLLDGIQIYLTKTMEGTEYLCLKESRSYIQMAADYFG